MRKPLPYTILLVALHISLSLFSQPLPVNDGAIAAKYPFVSTVFNRVFNSGGLDSFYLKLYSLKSGKGMDSVVTIVHIGDSHIQPDFISSVLRNGLQDFFGNAGRGLVFPYQQAASNAPEDIQSVSAFRWDFNRIAHPEIDNDYGVSGFRISSDESRASLAFNLRASSAPTPFNHLKFFLDSNAASWYLRLDSSDERYELRKTDSLSFRELRLPHAITGFSLEGPSGESYKALYGISLENDQRGVRLHSIGVNGARYDQYNIASLFWQQLPALEADLYIVSLGTNEAQRAAFSPTAFSAELDRFIRQLKISSPRASILLTTAPDSYKGRSSNRVLQQLNQFLVDYCNRHYLPYWDLYRITNGYGSAYSWARRGLMSRDRIHFTAEAYRLQGTLLLNALSKGYNSFLQLQGR